VEASSPNKIIVSQSGKEGGMATRRTSGYS